MTASVSGFSRCQWSVGDSGCSSLPGLVSRAPSCKKLCKLDVIQASSQPCEVALIKPLMDHKLRKSHTYVTPAQLADLAQEASLRLFPTRSERLTGVPGASKVVICIPSHETPTSCSGLLIVCVRAQNPSNLNWSWHPINSNSNSGSFFFFFFLKTVIPSWTRLGKKLFCQGS